MVLGKSFRDFVLGKTRTATRNAMEALAYNTVKELQEAGPYWDGYFANAWEVKAGDVEIPATTRGAIPSSEAPADQRVYTQPIVPPADLRKGYTIGNSMEYRAIAMDLEPGRIKNGPGTAEQDWYLKVVDGGELIRINSKAAKDAFKEAFK